MARAIAHAIRDKATLLIDAPTGVGKSLAALVPVAYDVLDDGPQAAYATATIALQEQLTRKDIPIVQQALGGPTAAIMKGMNRYACLLKWAGERDQLDIGTRGTTYDVFAEWIETTQEGDSGELAPLPPFWSQIAASSDDCLGAKCSYRDDCFALRAARKAAESQLVVLNHHLLLFHARYRKTGELPATWVVDEAHKFPGIAAEVFGGVLSERALDGLLRRVHGLIEDRWHPLHTAARHAADEHDTFMARFVVAPGEAQELRVSATDLSRYRNALTLLDSVLSGVSDDAGREVGGVPFKDRRSMARKALTGYITTVDDVFTAGGAHARWVEVQGARRVFKSVPIDTGPVLAPMFAAVEDPKPRILMSATLAAGGNFSHIKRQIGAPGARTLALPPIFDYRTQMRYYLPTPPLDPRSPRYTDGAIAIVHELLVASRGRALVLFTSYAQMADMADRLRDARLPFPLLVQDTQSGSRLVEEFRGNVSSVLLGTARYWQGIDVPGPSLSLVVAMRIPFDVPTHPLANARATAAAAAGADPFATISLPEAIVKLRQGVGRLIRSHQDRGVVALLDGRVETKPYGRTIMRALPPAPILRQVDQVAAFLVE